MKKLFTLLTLLLGVGSSVWAASYIPTTLHEITETQTIIVADQTNGTASTVVAAGKTDGWIVIPAESYSAKGVVEDPDGDIETPTDEAYCLQVKKDGGVFNSSKRVIHMLVTGVSGVKVIGQSNSGRGFQIGATEYTEGMSETTAMTIVAGSTEASNPLACDGLDPEKEYIISVFAYNGDVYLYAVQFIVPDASQPFISASNTSIMATESGVPAKEDVSVTGSNLTGSTLTATLNPAVDGLSVVLESDAITDGSIETTAHVSYVATENVDESTTTLILSDGTTTREVTITYSAFVVPYEQESISEATTWDFAADVSGSVQYGANERQERLYANITGLTYQSTFNAMALTFEGEYPCRDGKYTQNGTLRFNTTVPGTVEVTFSNTGGNNKNRWVSVNGTVGQVEADGTTMRTETFTVGAGDVVITGYNPEEGGTTALRFSKVVFTPADPVTATITSAGVASFSSVYALDFTNSDVKAYVITGKNGSKFTSAQVTLVPANTGVILKGAEGTYEIPFASETPEEIENNLLVATSTGAYTTTSDDYGYVYGLFQTTAGKIGFQKKKVGWTCLVNRCYVRLPETSSADSFMLDFETTAINAIETVSEDFKGQTYNLGGQKVNANYKGIVIRDGKKQMQR